MAGPLKDRGGAKRVCHKGKITFFTIRKKVPMANKPRGGGTKGLSGRATKKITFFCGFPKVHQTTLCCFFSFSKSWVSHFPITRMHGADSEAEGGGTFVIYMGVILLTSLCLYPPPPHVGKILYPPL